MKISDVKNINSQKVMDFLKNNWVLVAGVLVAVYFLTPLGASLKTWFANYKAKQAALDYQNSTVTVAVAPAVQYNLQQVANEVYTAFHDSGLFGLSEDEERAIDAIKSIPQVYVKQVAVLYAKKGKDLYTDFVKYLSKEDYARVEAWLK